MNEAHLADDPVHPDAAPTADRSDDGPAATGLEAGLARRGPASAVLGVAIAALAAVAGHLGRSLFWFSDDWNILTSYHRGHLLEPFNGHLSLVPAGIFQALYRTVGVGSYSPYRFVGLACYLGFGVVLYRYGRRQVHPMLAALATTLLLWLSVAGFNLTFPFLINFTIPLAATVACWWLLERDTPRHDAWAAACVGLALASSALGVVTVIAVVAELVWRRAGWRRFAPHVVPVGLWAGWYVGWSDATTDPGGMGTVLTYARQELQATFWAVGGTNRALGALVAVAVLVVYGLAATRWRSIDARAVSATAAFVGFIGLTAYSRVGIVPRIPPDTGRYLWVNLVYLLVALFALLRGRRIHPAALLALAALVALNGTVLVRDLRSHRTTVDTYAATVRVNLVAAELAGPAAPRDRILPLSLIAVDVGDYLDAVADVGSPIEGEGPGQLGPDGIERVRADERLVGDLGLQLAADDRSAPCQAAVAGTATVPAGTRVVVQAASADVAVGVRRLSGATATPLGVVPAGQARTLALPDDADHDLGARFPWTVVAAGATVAHCP